jgi:hypothetical protein
VVLCCVHFPSGNWMLNKAWHFSLGGLKSPQDVVPCFNPECPYLHGYAIPYRQRGWCEAEAQWSAMRGRSHSSVRIDVDMEGRTGRSYQAKPCWWPVMAGDGWCGYDPIWSMDSIGFRSLAMAMMAMSRYVFVFESHHPSRQLCGAVGATRLFFLGGNRSEITIVVQYLCCWGFPMYIYRSFLISPNCPNYL